MFRPSRKTWRQAWLVLAIMVAVSFAFAGCSVISQAAAMH